MGKKRNRDGKEIEAFIKIEIRRPLFLSLLFCFFFFVFCFLFFISSTKGVRFGKTSIPGVQYQYQTAEPGGGEGR